MKRTLLKMRSGFTIVELLVVIVIISILVAVIMVSYGTYQERTRDAERKSDVAQIAAALKSYANWKNTYVETGDGCGNAGNGTGWVAAGSADVSGYQNSIVSCLVAQGYLKTGDGVDPTGCKYNSGGTCGTGNPTRAYMKITCTFTGGIKKTYVMASLETAPANNAPIDALCTSASGCIANCSTQTWGTTYGMNYYVEAT